MRKKQENIISCITMLFTSFCLELEDSQKMFLIWLFANITISVSARKFYLRAKVARVAWWFGFLVWWKRATKPWGSHERSAEAVKTSGKAAGNHLPGRPTFFIATPIAYFDHPMTGSVNCNKKLPATKTKLSDEVFARLQRTAKSVNGGNREKCKR